MSVGMTRASVTYNRVRSSRGWSKFDKVVIELQTCFKGAVSRITVFVFSFTS